MKKPEDFQWSVVIITALSVVFYGCHMIDPVLYIDNHYRQRVNDLENRVAELEAHHTRRTISEREVPEMQ